MLPSHRSDKPVEKKCLNANTQQDTVSQLKSTGAMSRILSSRVIIERLSVQDIEKRAAGSRDMLTRSAGITSKLPAAAVTAAKVSAADLKVRQKATASNSSYETCSEDVICGDERGAVDNVHNCEEASSAARVVLDTPPLTSEEGSLSQGQESSCDNLDMLTVAANEDHTDNACMANGMLHPCLVVSQEEFCGLFGLVTLDVMQKLKNEGHKMHRSAGGKLRHNVKSRLTPDHVLRRARMTKQSFVPGVADGDALPLADSSAVANGMEKTGMPSSKHEKREWLRPPARRSLDDGRVLSGDDNLVQKKSTNGDLSALGARRSQRRGAVERRRWHHLLRGREDEDDSWERRRTPLASHRREDMETDGEESKGASDATGASDIDWSQSSDVLNEAIDKGPPLLSSKLMMVSRMVKSLSEPQITSVKKKRRADEGDVKTSPLHRSPKRATGEVRDKVKDGESGRVKPASLECLVPHMCRICWINDHMYCKNMKRIARDLPPCGGCLHYVPCEHYRHLRESYLSTAVSTVVMRPFETLLNPLPQPMVSSSDDDDDVGVMGGGKEPVEQPSKYATCADDLICHEVMLDSDHEQRAEGTELLSAQLKARAVKSHPRTASRHQAKKTGRQISPKREEQVVQVCDYGAEVVLDVSGRNLTKESKPLPIPIDTVTGRKSVLGGGKRDDGVVVMPHVIKSSVLLSKTPHSVSLSHEAATSLLHLKRGSALPGVVHERRRSGAEEAEESRVGVGRVGRADDAVKLAAVNSDMLGTLIVRKAMSLLHTRQPMEEYVEEEGESITVLLSNSPELDEDDVYSHLQPQKATYAPTPSVLRKTASLPLTAVRSSQQSTGQSRAPVLLTARMKNVQSTASVKVESDTGRIASRTGVTCTAGAINGPFVIKPEGDEAQVEHTASVRRGGPVGQAESHQLWIKPEPEDDYGDGVSIDIFAEVDVDGTVRTCESGGMAGHSQWQSGTPVAQYACDTLDIVCAGEVELSTDTVLTD